MDVFAHPSFDAARPITTAIDIVTAAAGRIALSMVRSANYLPRSMLGAVGGILSPSHLWTLAIVLAAWIVASLVGGPVAAAINGILLVYGLWELYQQLSGTWEALRRWAQTAYSARSDGDLDTAAQLFAQVLSEGGLTILEAIVTHRVFTKVSGSLSKRVPRPEWLDREYEAARRKIGEREAGTANRASAEPSRRRPAIAETVKAAATTAAGTGLAGPPHEAEFPTGIVIGGVCSLALLGVLWATLGSKPHGR